MCAWTLVPTPGDAQGRTIAIPLQGERRRAAAGGGSGGSGGSGGTAGTVGSADDCRGVSELLGSPVWRRVARFSFADLCESARGASDYTAIAAAFDAVFLSDVPALSLQQINAVRLPARAHLPASPCASADMSPAIVC